MAKRPQNLPALNRAELEAINLRLSKIASPRSRRLIMDSLNAAANPKAESPEYGIQSLPPERRKIADSSVRDTAQVFSFTNNFAIPIDEQLEFNEELAEMQSEGRVIEYAFIIGLLAYFLFPQNETKSLYDSILSAYVSAYQLALKEQAGRYGCAFARIGNPTAYSMAEMQAWAQRDSESIAKTYDKEAESALRKLYDANPLGTISYYVNGMAQWAVSSRAKRNLVIGIQNAQKGYGLGLQDFHVMNQLETKYRLVGAPPVCPVCVRVFSMGYVDYAFAASYGMAGLHIGCPHWFESVRTYQIDCATMWSGV
jgi:hypothetical protein